MGFYDNGVERGKWSGELDWQKGIYVMKGKRNIEWAIDNVKFPLLQLTFITFINNSCYFYIWKEKEEIKELKDFCLWELL